MEVTAGRLGLKKTIPNSQPVATITNTATNGDDDDDEDDDNDVTHVDEFNNDTSAVNLSETYPRRSLRKQGIGPLEDGIPYYESIRSYKRRISTAEDKSDDEESNGDPINHSEQHHSEKEDSNKDMSSDVETEHNVSSETTLNTSSVTGKCQSFMVKNLLDLKSPQDSIPPVHFSTPTHSVATNGPILLDDHSLEPANTSTTNLNTSQQKTSTKQTDTPHTSHHTSELMETTSSQHVSQDIPIINKHQLRQIFHYAIQSTNRTTVSHLEKLHNCLEHAVFRHRMEKNKRILLEVSNSGMRD